MKIFCLLFLLLISFTALPQNYYYAWLSDIHIGAPEADADLDSVVADINLRDSIAFVIATGDIAEKGRNDELEKAKEILDKLQVPYFIIPGNHDTKWSESGLTMFGYLWGDDKFIQEYEGDYHIGMNSGIPWRGGGGHFTPEDIDWLKETLQKIGSNPEIFFYAHHPLDGDVDNWFKVTNLLRDYNIKAIFTGHGHSNRLLNFNGIPAAMGRSTLSRPNLAGYTIVKNSNDSLFFYEVTSYKAPKNWGAISKIDTLEIPVIDSTQFIASGKAGIVWQEDLEKTLSAPLLVTEDRIYAAFTDGAVYCFTSTGEIKWEYETGGTIFSRPARDKDVLAVGTIEGDLFSFNSNTGQVLQIIGLGEAITSQLVIVDAAFEGKKTRGVIAGTASGNMYCYDLYSLQLIWENQSAGGMIETEPLLVSDKLIYGSWDNYLYCIDVKSGSLIWKWTENKNFYYSPAAVWPVTDGENVYVSTPDKFISAVDLLQGKTMWRKDDFKSWESIGISEDKYHLLIKSMTNKFYKVSAKDGKLIKEIDLEFGLDTMPFKPIEWKGKYLFGAKNGNVYIIDKEYNWEPLLFLGTARAHSVQHIGGNKFAASNMDGNIVVFELKEK